MSGIDTGFVELSRRDRLSQWVFWSFWSTIVLIAAAFYYDKANEQRSAFVRWRPQVLQFAQGVNIYEKMLFPTPPLMPITLYPLMVLPTVAGAMCWFALKVAMTGMALVLCFDFVRPKGGFLPPMFRSLVLLLSLRPILGDLHHGNNNLLILFLIVLMLAAWREGYDLGAGLLLGTGDHVQGDPGALLRVLRLQGVVADGRLGVARDGHLPADRPQHDHRTGVQRRVPGDVVEPDGHARS